jgi:hypothetical protein
MGIDAVALLRGKDLPLPAGVLLRTLDDGVLVFTLARFSADLEQMALALRLRLGGALDAHHDERGVFLIPDVAEPRATTYEGVIAEVGEAGVWAPVVAAGHVPASLASAPEGSFAAIMGEVMGALGGDAMATLMQAVATGDAAAMAAVQAKIVEALGGQEGVEAIGTRLTEAAQAELPAVAEAVEARLRAAQRLPVDLGAIDPDAVEVMRKRVEAHLAATPGLAEELEKKLKG